MSWRTFLRGLFYFAAAWIVAAAIAYAHFVAMGGD